MKFYRFAKAGLLAAGFLTCHCVPAGAQAQKQPYPVTADGSHSLKSGEVLVPAALFGVSALFVHNGWLAGRKENVQDALSAGGRRKFKADDYSQYAPMAAVYGLNLCGVEGKHRIVDRSVILAMSYATMGILVNSMKFAFRERRPDSGARNSFPSGHTATAFMGAEFLYKEYKDVSPWIGYAGYAVAAATGYLRIYNDRHYINDVVAGACIGVISTKLAYWLYPKIFTKSACRRAAAVTGLPYYFSGEWGVNVCVVF